METAINKAGEIIRERYNLLIDWVETEGMI